MSEQAVQKHREAADQVLANMTEFMQDKLPEREELDRVYFSDRDMLSGKVALSVTMVVTQKFKNGKSRQVTRNTFVQPAYCPFTGEKLSDD